MTNDGANNVTSTIIRGLAIQPDERLRMYTAMEHVISNHLIIEEKLGINCKAMKYKCVRKIHDSRLKE